MDAPLNPCISARFNDGILPAALLKSHHQSELDYSASSDLNHRSALHCEKKFTGHRRDGVDAALEFVYVLNTDKAALRKNNTDWVQHTIEGIEVLNASQRLLEVKQSEIPE